MRISPKQVAALAGVAVITIFMATGGMEKSRVTGANSAFQKKELLDTLKKDTVIHIPLEEAFPKNFPKNPEYEPFPPNYKPKNNEAPKKKENEERMWPDIYNV